MKMKYIYFLVLIIILTGVIFSPCLKNNFINFDDDKMVYSNPLIRVLDLKNIFRYFTEFHYGLYNPLVLLSYSIEYKFFGLVPSVYHMTNLILHLSNCILVWWLIFLISKNIQIAYAVSILFGIHPLHVESVVWISERKDVLFALFFLSGLISYFYYLTKKEKKYLYISFILNILSLMSKPMAVSFPLALLTLDYFIKKKINIKDIYEKALFFILSVIFTILTVLGQRSISNIVEKSNGLTNIFSEIMFYICKTVYPEKLSCVYPPLSEWTGIYGLIFKIAPLILIIAGILVFIYRKKLKKMIFGFSFFIVTLLPVLHFIPTGRVIPADRYTYIPLIGIFYIFADYYFNIVSCSRKHFLKIIFYVTAIVLITVFSLQTYRYCKVWENSITLWSYVIERYPTVKVAYSDRGLEYLERKEYEKALSDFNRAIELDPYYSKSYDRRANVYAEIGLHREALLDYNKAIELDPKVARYYNNRGNTFADLKDYKNAIDDFNRAIKINPCFAEAYYNRAAVYSTTGEIEKAITDYSKAIEINSSFALAYFNRGLLYKKINKFQEAKNDLEIAGQLDPSLKEEKITDGEKLNDKAKYYYDVGNENGKNGDYDSAIRNFTKAIEISPDFYDAYYARAVAYYMKKDYENAWRDIRILQKKKYRIKPEFLKLLEGASSK